MEARSTQKAKEHLLKKKLSLILFLAAFISVSWGKEPGVPVLHQNMVPAFPAVVSEGQPAGLPFHKEKLENYYYSGSYEKDVGQVINQASVFLNQHAGNYKKPAIVLDIDETSLSNWILLADIQFNNPSPASWAKWVQAKQAWAMGPTWNLFNQAKSLNVTVFFITGRDESEREDTEQNLKDAGYSGWEEIIFKDKSYPYTASFKAPRRKAIEEMGYTIILNVGDQLSDLTGGFALATYQLPNPFYLVK